MAVTARLGHQFMADFFGGWCTRGPRSGGVAWGSDAVRVLVQQPVLADARPARPPACAGTSPSAYESLLSDPACRAEAAGLAKDLTVLLAQYCGLMTGEDSGALSAVLRWARLLHACPPQAP